MISEKNKKRTGLALLVAGVITIGTGFKNMGDHQARYFRGKETKTAYYSVSQRNIKIMFGALSGMAIGTVMATSKKRYLI